MMNSAAVVRRTLWPCRAAARWCGTASTVPDYSGTPRTEYDNAKPFSDIPGPGGLPYLGTMLQYRNGPFKRFSVDRFQDALKERRRQYGDIVKETIAGDTIVHLFNPDDIRTVLQTQGKTPHVVPLLNTTKMFREKKGIALGLGNTNGEEWYRLRSAVIPMMMRPKAVTVYLPLVDEVASEFVARLKKIRDEKNEIADLQNEVSKWNIESAAMTLFETRLGALDGDQTAEIQEVIDSAMKVFALTARLKFSLPWHKVFQTPLLKEHMEAENCLLTMSEKYLSLTLRKIQTLVDSGQLRDGQFSFLSYLLAREELNHQDVSVITLSLFGDGLGTTAPTLTNQLYCLARYPDIQKKVYEEIREKVPGQGAITADDISKLTYLKAFSKEAFRFVPNALNVDRAPKQNLVLSGYQIPAETHLEMNNFVNFMDEKYFTEPKRFRPERWLRGGSAHNVHPFIVIPFGHGPRMCIGRRFAEQEMYVVMTKILQNFRLEWHYPDLPQKYQILMVPGAPVRITFRDRKFP